MGHLWPSVPGSNLAIFSLLPSCSQRYMVTQLYAQALMRFHVPHSMTETINLLMLFTWISDSALTLWSGAIKCTVAIVSAGFRVEQHLYFLTWTLKIIFIITIIITVIYYYTIAQGQGPCQLGLMQSPRCVGHPSSVGSRQNGSKAKQLKCHQENKFPVEISGKAPTTVLLPSCSTVPGEGHREFRCRST